MARSSSITTQESRTCFVLAAERREGLGAVLVPGPPMLPVDPATFGGRPPFAFHPDGLRRALRLALGTLMVAARDELNELLLCGLARRDLPPGQLPVQVATWLPEKAAPP
ncbi:MAG: hypothetical protein AVDCRST_MAG55-1246 [uncultured Rubrobacteraceae bacterium]|uniref:Uncharacterized protein n=1 Tax=uncultured Rubrobacteraceae bacterium TaxID=349277 RepID=A0A6J4P9I3_9ACTN|nr:MAG: hypothetical protein AVDCRST_MAG55-1246 [uncultured Rubrobacteraceae bacterium]